MPVNIAVIMMVERRETPEGTSLYASLFSKNKSKSKGRWFFFKRVVLVALTLLTLSASVSNLLSHLFLFMKSFG